MPGSFEAPTGKAFAMLFTRRRILSAGSTAVLAGVAAPHVARAQRAEFTYKYANNLPDTHPMNVRAREMAEALRTESGGRFDLKIFPTSQLGSDTDTLSQLRNGGVEFFTMSPLILSTLVPNASINGIGYAFPDYDKVWAAIRRCNGSGRPAPAVAPTSAATSCSTAGA